MVAAHETEKKAVVSVSMSSGKIWTDQDEAGGLCHQGDMLSMGTGSEFSRRALFVFRAQV